MRARTLAELRHGRIYAAILGRKGYKTLLSSLGSGRYSSVRYKAAALILVSWAVELIAVTASLTLLVVALAAGVHFWLVAICVAAVGLGISGSGLPRRASRMLTQAAQADEAFLNYALECGLFSLELAPHWLWAGPSEFKGPTHDLMLYMERVQYLTGQVVGNDFLESISRIDGISWGDQPWLVERDYYMAFCTLRDAAKRVLQHPDRYSALVEWDDQETIHGKGRPTVPEALFETFIDDFSEGYCIALDRLEEKYGAEGRIEEREQCKQRKAEVAALGAALEKAFRTSVASSGSAAQGQ